jgi:PiT family inorganic phosphate transporter
VDPIYLIVAGSATAIGLYMAWSIGANDVANSMATSVGSKAITFKQAVLIAGILNVCGAVFVGSHVAETVKGGIIDTDLISNGDVQILIIGFISSLLAAAIWVTLSTWKEMPISTTHSVVGALVGFGLITSGISCVNWGTLAEIASSWVLSPIVGAIIGFLVFKLIVKTIFARDQPVKAAKIVGPIIIGLTFALIASSLLLKTQLSEMFEISDTNQIILISILTGCIFAVISWLLLRNIKGRNSEDYDMVEHGIFRKMQIITACYVAFSHGANDVANAIGPVAAIFSLIDTGVVSEYAPIPLFLLLLGGVGIAVGCLTWGGKVMRTVGGRITQLNHTRGFSVEFAAATTVLAASKLGMPVSTSHTVVGAVIGVGLARGLEAVDLSIIKKIVISWLLTVPVAAATSAGIFILITHII